MSQENVEIVRAFIDASGRGDLDALMAALDPNDRVDAGRVGPRLCGAPRP